MKPISLRSRGLVVPAIIVLSAACGNSPQQETVPVEHAVATDNYYIGKEDLYAHLESGSGGSWIFTKVTESDLQPSKGFLVRINDLAPAFDTRVAECTPQAYPANHKCNPIHPFRSKNVSFIGRIINGGIAAGTVGKVTEVTRTYETSFDETAFNQAVDEALTNTGLGTERQEFLTAIENYAVILADSRAELQDLERQIDAKYRDTEAVELDIEAEVTGLTAYYTEDIDFRDLVELVPQSATASNRLALEEQKLIPCDARQCADRARNAIATVHRAIDNAKYSLAERSESGMDVYDVRCDKTHHAGYLFTLECPPELARTGIERPHFPISVHMLARDFEGLYPGVDIADDKLSVTIDGGSVAFTNLTADYLSVTAQTVYYNSQVQTSSSVISVAPSATVLRPVSDFVSPAIDVESSYRQMTPDKAEGASFEFGFAAQYRAAGESSDTTLYDMRTFNVGCAIDNRVKPGSCKESTAEDAQAREFNELLPHVPN